MMAPSPPSPTRRILRRVSGQIRRLSISELSNFPRLSAIFEQGRRDDFDYDDEEPVIMSASMVQLPMLSSSAREISLSAEIETEFQRIRENSARVEAFTTQDNTSTASNSNIPDRKDKEIPQMPALPMPPRRPRTSSLPKKQTPPIELTTSPSINWLPDPALRAAIRQTLRVQTALNAGRLPAAESSSQFLQAPKIINMAEDREPNMADALSHALAIAHLTRQVQPGQMVSEVMKEVINLLRFPQSAERDRGIKAIINTIPRSLSVGSSPMQLSEQDQRLLAAITHLEEQLELQ